MWVAFVYIQIAPSCLIDSHLMVQIQLSESPVGDNTGCESADWLTAEGNIDLSIVVISIQV